MRRATAVLVVVLLGSGCVGPSRTDRDFELKAANTAKAVASALETARLAADGAGAGKVSANYVSVIVGEAEADATSAQSTFASYQPPSAAADKLRNDVDDVLSNAVDGLVALRITARRGQLDRLPRISEQLAPVSTALEQLQQRYG
jgi:hypothetical protein